jgi:GTP cyclohydrolase IV
VSLSRGGVTGVEKVIPMRSNATEQLFYSELECFVDLGPEQKGAHMSRFEEVVNEAIDGVVLGEAFKAETLASNLAERVRIAMTAGAPRSRSRPLSGARRRPSGSRQLTADARAGYR